MRILLTLLSAFLFTFFTGCAKKVPDAYDATCPKMVTANGMDICTESFGSPKDPALLLIMGATASMLSWEEDFSKELAKGGRYVIRYDNRDTGRSVTYPPGKPEYNLDDLAKDAVGVLDAYGIDRAHIAGASMGGMIAQLIGIEYPERVLSLTLIMSSPHGPEDPDLPPMSQKVLDHFAKGSSIDWTSEAAIIGFRVDTMRVIAGSKHSFDEQSARRLLKREFRRANNIASTLTNHSVMASNRWRDRLGEINAPTLVIHGTEDPVLPFGHGVALSKEIKGAKLLPLEGSGHELRHDDWSAIIPAILTHTSLQTGAKH